MNFGVIKHSLVSDRVTPAHLHPAPIRIAGAGSSTQLRALASILPCRLRQQGLQVVGQHCAIPHQPLLGRRCGCLRAGACFEMQIRAVLSSRILQEALCCLLYIVGRALSCYETPACLLLCWRLQLLQVLGPVAALLAQGA